MSLQRRLLLYLLVCAPVVWGATLYFSVNRARHGVNELFDTELIRLARQVYSTLGPSSQSVRLPLPPIPAGSSVEAGDSDLRELAVAVWDEEGQLMLADREGAQLPYRADARGFVDEQVGKQTWRVYYMASPDGRWLVAAGQDRWERDELVYQLTVTQVVPWLLLPGFAGTPPAAPVPSSTATPLSASAGLASGEVRKVDRESKRLTLDHGPLANLNMVAMTMAFRVKDDAMLERVKVGDKVRFHVEKIDGRYIVTHLERASP